MPNKIQYTALIVNAILFYAGIIGAIVLFTK